MKPEQRRHFYSSRELEDKIVCRTRLGVEKFEFDKRHFVPCLRTPVGLSKIDVTGVHDYVAKEPYENIEKVIKLCDFKGELPADYWSNYTAGEFKRSRGHAAVVCRINPYSPSQMLTAFYSEVPLVLANVFNIINDTDKNRAKAVTVLLNSVFFLAYFFNIKEETTGRYTELRLSDLSKMKLFPQAGHVDKLVSVYEKYKDKEFPSLREQLDIHFDARYKWFWRQEREGQSTSHSPPPIEPHPLRLQFDMDVVKAISANLSEYDLLEAYKAMIQDIIITRGLRKD